VALASKKRSKDEALPLKREWVLFHALLGTEPLIITLRLTPPKRRIAEFMQQGTLMSKPAKQLSH